MDLSISYNQGFCRPGGYGLFIGEPTFSGDPRRATLKAHPSTLHPARPYGFMDLEI